MKGADMEHVTGFSPLTLFEVTCLRRCAEGKTDAEIGIEFELTIAEVESVFADVLMKLHAPNRLTGLTRAMRLGLLNKKAA